MEESFADSFHDKDITVSGQTDQSNSINQNKSNGCIIENDKATFIAQNKKSNIIRSNTFDPYSMSNRENKTDSNDSTSSNTDIDEFSDFRIHETNDEHEIKSIISVTPSASTINDKKIGKLTNAHCHDTNETHDIDNETTISVTPGGNTIIDTNNGELSEYHHHNTNNMQDYESNFGMNDDTPEDLILENFEFSITLSRSVVRCLSPIDPRSLSRSIVVESHIESRGNVMLY